MAKGLMSSTMALLMRNEYWYISLPFSAKQQHQMTKSYVIVSTTANFLSFFFEMNAVLLFRFRSFGIAQSDSDRQTE